jgi:ATP-binding cassette, subfamily F, member 3
MAGSRTGDFVWRAKDLKVGYDAARPLLSIPELEVQRGQRVAIVGTNGSGKTTLLRTILDELPALGGAIRPGANVRLGYLSQTHSELSEEATALECLRQIEPSLQEEKARSLLGALLLSGDDAFKKVSELSGGQRSRLTLARLVLQKANVLVMDEPTNHLDIASQEVLQEVLSEYDGTVIFVSHDRYLIRALATHIWAVRGGTVTPMSGDWEKYVAWRDGHAGGGGARGGAAQAAKAKETRKEKHKDRRKKTNESLATQRRLSAVETEIHKLEVDLKGLGDRIGQAGEAGDVDRVTQLGLEYEQADARLRELFAEWEKLGAAVEE